MLSNHRVHCTARPELLVLLELLVYYLVLAAAPTNHPRAMETDAKDKSTEIGSPGFNPLDARAMGEPEAVRIGRATFKQFLGLLVGRPTQHAEKCQGFEKK